MLKYFLVFSSVNHFFWIQVYAEVEKYGEASPFDLEKSLPYLLMAIDDSFANLEVSIFSSEEIHKVILAYCSTINLNLLVHIYFFHNYVVLVFVLFYLLFFF